MANKLVSGLVISLFAFLPRCLAIESADRTASLASTLMLQQFVVDSYLNSGHCALQANHQLLAGTFLVTCAGVPRRYCNSSQFPWSAGELNKLDGSIEQSGNQYLLCAGDAASERTYLASISAPNEPLLGKLGASRAAFDDRIAYRVVDSCAHIELASSAFAGPGSSGLLNYWELRGFQEGALWLKRFAASSGCRNAIALPGAEDQLNAALRDGLRRDYLACDYGLNNDAGLSDCPQAARALFQ